MQSVPCGCDGLAFLPFLSGSVDPDACPEARAVFFGARLSTTRAHFARSVMESVAFLLRDFFGMLNALGCPADTVYSLGGGARSAVWQQIKADACGRTFRVPACSEATAMGAALLAGWGSGLIAPGVFPCRCLLYTSHQNIPHRIHAYQRKDDAEKKYEYIVEVKSQYLAHAAAIFAVSAQAVV